MLGTNGVKQCFQSRVCNVVVFLLASHLVSLSARRVPAQPRNIMGTPLGGTCVLETIVYSRVPCLQGHHMRAPSDPLLVLRLPWLCTVVTN